MTRVVFGEQSQQRFVPYFKWYEANEVSIEKDPFWAETDGFMRDLPQLKEEEILSLQKMS